MSGSNSRSSSSKKSNEPIRGSDGIARCREHATPCAEFTSRTPSNPGRVFYKCGEPVGKQCGAWAWADSIPGGPTAGGRTLGGAAGPSTPSTPAAARVSNFSTSSPSQAAASAAAARGRAGPAAWDAPAFSLPTPPISSKKAAAVAANKRKSPSPDWWPDDDDLDEQLLAKMELPEPASGGARALSIKRALEIEDDIIEITSDDEWDGTKADGKRPFSFRDRLDHAAAPSSSKKARVEADSKNPFNATPSPPSLTRTLEDSPPPTTILPSKLSLSLAAAAPSTPKTPSNTSRDARLLAAANKSLAAKKSRIAELEEKVEILEREKARWTRESNAMRRKIDSLQNEALLR